jgi:GTP cyclohydrolase I
MKHNLSKAMEIIKDMSYKYNIKEQDRVEVEKAVRKIADDRDSAVMFKAFGQNHCGNCKGVILYRSWSMCPYCGYDVAGRRRKKL